MGLNLSGLQIVRELGIDKSDARAMVTTLRQGIVDRTPHEVLSSRVECREVDVMAGPRGHPEAVEEKGAATDGGG